MLIIAGLGNPGPKYAANRHNIGFMAVDAIHRKNPFSPWSKKFKGEISEGELGGEKVLLIKPQTFMNLSGESVGEAMRFYKLAPKDILAIYDELDLAPGKARIKVGGGHGGHNGVKSLDAHCGKDYRRVRLGIGHPGSKDRVTGYVLGDFAKADAEWLNPLIEAVGSHADMLAKGDDAGFMNKVALAMGSMEPADDKPAKPAAKKQSHIHQARPAAKKPPMAKAGPMADLLKKLLGNKDDN